MFLRPNHLQKKSCFTQNCVIHKHNVLHKNHVLAGPVHGLFAAYRIALSMVAGRTRRRRLDTKTLKHVLTRAHHLKS